MFFLGVDVMIHYFAAIGFVISFYIFLSKFLNQPLVCFMPGCNEVIDSKYAYFFYLHNSFVGLLFYGLIIVVDLQGLLVYSFVKLVVVLATAIACVFSVYLLFVQNAILKQRCCYCVFSAIMVFAIAILL